MEVETTEETGRLVHTLMVYFIRNYNDVDQYRVEGKELEALPRNARSLDRIYGVVEVGSGTIIITVWPFMKITSSMK